MPCSKWYSFIYRNFLFTVLLTKVSDKSLRKGARKHRGHGEGAHRGEGGEGEI